MLLFLRFLRGYVSFFISGRYPERFINIAARNSVRLWKVRRSGDGYTACMYMSDYRAIRRLARSSGVRLKLSAKYGLPTYLARFRGRAGVLIGACVYVLTIFVMSQFIWSVDISGIETISVSEMQTVLRDNGICVGAFKPALDFQDAARDILLQNSDIGWMAINVTGSYASVEIKEEAQAPEVYDTSEPCNVKASRDGLILRIDAEQGVSVIQEGSAVIAGQMIVSGVMEDERGGVRLEHAEAQVMAQTVRKAVFSVSESGSTLLPDGEKAVRKSWRVLGATIPVSAESVDAPYSSVYTTEEAPSPLDVTLPLGVITEEISSLHEKEYFLDEISAKELLINRSSLYEMFTLSGCEVIDRAYRLSYEDGVYTLSVEYTCVEDIAYTEPIGTDENTDTTRIAPDPTEETR